MLRLWPWWCLHLGAGRLPDPRGTASTNGGCAWRWADGRGGSAHGARSGGHSGGHSWGLTEWSVRLIIRRGFRGTRQRWLNGRMTRPRTPCAPGMCGTHVIDRAGITRGTPYRTRRKSNHQGAGRNISHPPSFGRSRPISHISRTHTHRTGNPSTSFFLPHSTFIQQYITGLRAGR